MAPTRQYGPIPVEIDRLLPDSFHCLINWWNWRRTNHSAKLYYPCAEEPAGREPAIDDTLTVEPSVQSVVCTNDPTVERFPASEARLHNTTTMDHSRKRCHRIWH